MALLFSFTMADSVTANSNKSAIFGRTVFLVNSGQSLKNACETVEAESGRKWQSTKQLYVRYGGSQERKHGLCKLTLEQESILLSMVIVYSAMHETLSLGELQEHVQKSFGVDVGKKWASGFMKRHKEELSERKTRLLASKRIDETIAGHVAEFIGQVEMVSQAYPMRETNVFNYDETCVYIADEGPIRLEHSRK